LCMLDTNICIYLIKRKPMHVVDKLRTLDPGEVAVSSITVAELQYGVFKSDQPDRNREALAEFLLPLEVLPFDENASCHYGDIRNTLEKMGNVIGSMDLLIAAHARSLSLTLITNNLLEFQRVPGLRTDNWA
jgi:tRNA(fMet)-specific endonuclease VapC